MCCVDVGLVAWLPYCWFLGSVVSLSVFVLFIYSFFSFFFFSSRRRHTRSDRDWSSDVCSSDLRKRAVRTAMNDFIYPPKICCPSVSIITVSDKRELIEGIFRNGMASFAKGEIGRASCRERV